MSNTVSAVSQGYQILTGFKKCLSLWQEVEELTRTQPSMETDTFRQMSDSLKQVLVGAETAVQSVRIPQDQKAFNQGDFLSQESLRIVIDGQKTIVANIDEIKNRLERARHEQFNSDRKAAAPPAELDLDVYTINSLREIVEDHIKMTKEALVALAARIDSRETASSYQSPPARPRPLQAPENDIDPPSPAGPALPSRSPRQSPQRPEPPPSPSSRWPSLAEITPDTPGEYGRTTRPDEGRPPAALEPLSCVPSSSGTYCPGAIRLQNDGNLHLRDILRSDNPSMLSIGSTLVCKYCHLQVGSRGLQDLVFSGDAAGTDIARQHIMACASMIDRRAMFRCLMCDRNGVDAEFREMDEFKEHTKLPHRGFPSGRNRGKVEAPI